MTDAAREVMRQARYGDPVDTYTWDRVVDRCLEHLAAQGFVITQEPATTAEAGDKDA